MSESLYNPHICDSRSLCACSSACLCVIYIGMHVSIGFQGVVIYLCEHVLCV